MGGEKSNNFLNRYGEAKAEPSVEMNRKGIASQRIVKQWNGTVRIRKATDGRSNAPQRNGKAV